MSSPILINTKAFRRFPVGRFIKYEARMNETHVLWEYVDPKINAKRLVYFCPKTGDYKGEL